MTRTFRKSIVVAKNVEPKNDNKARCGGKEETKKKKQHGENKVHREEGVGEEFVGDNAGVVEKHTSNYDQIMTTFSMCIFLLFLYFYFERGKLIINIFI